MRAAPLLLVLATVASAEIHRFGPAQAQAPSVAPPATHAIPLAVVILRGSGWSYDAVARRVEKTKEVVAQCGVRLDATITELAPPSGGGAVLYAPASADDSNGMGTITRVLAQPKPTMFYISAFEDDSGQTGTSRPPFQSAGKSEENTAWVPFVEDPPGEERPYQVDAHELVHVLADTPHVSLSSCPPRAHKEDPVDPACQDGGLMAGNPLIRSNRLSAELCEKIKARPYARPL